jgi:hypothetical protein
LNEYWIPSVRAAIELDAKPGVAIEALQQASAMENGTPLPLFLGPMYPAYLRGLAHLRKRDGKAAELDFKKVLDHPGIVLNYYTGALARLGLARAFALQGNAVGSRATYEDFFSFWKDADADIPILKQAKAEYAKLL